MKIPSIVKIAGHRYKVIFKKNLYRDYDAAGRSCANNLVIDLDPTGAESHIDEVFWHEVVEQLNYRYELGLSHEKISVLGVALHQFYADNPDFMITDW
jgi:hypothetical protein